MQIAPTKPLPASQKTLRPGSVNRFRSALPTVYVYGQLLSTLYTCNQWGQKLNRCQHQRSVV